MTVFNRTHHDENNPPPPPTYDMTSIAPRRYRHLYHNKVPSDIEAQRIAGSTTKGHVPRSRTETTDSTLTESTDASPTSVEEKVADTGVEITLHDFGGKDTSAVGDSRTTHGADDIANDKSRISKRTLCIRFCVCLFGLATLILIVGLVLGVLALVGVLFPREQGSSNASSKSLNGNDGAPTLNITLYPSPSAAPSSGSPSQTLSMTPSALLTTVPSPSPPSVAPPTTTTAGVDSSSTTTDTTSLKTTVCLLADTPYSEGQRIKLLEQIETLHDDCEFVAHLGDIKTGGQPCTEEVYKDASFIMGRSPKPVFMFVGDNEWNDCGNHEEALGFWHQEFDSFLEDRWPNHGFNVTQKQPGSALDLYFIHKKALFIGLNIVGGHVQDKEEWEERLTSNYVWTRSLIEKHVLDARDANVVVLMAHAQPNGNHKPFFEPMVEFIRDELVNTVPILYLNGDNHKWLYEPNFFEQSSWLRIMLTCCSHEPILKLIVDGSDGVSTVEEAFSYDRGE